MNGVHYGLKSVSDTCTLKGGYHTEKMSKIATGLTGELGRYAQERKFKLFTWKYCMLW
jgi:hypothetical protein